MAGPERPHQPALHPAAVRTAALRRAALPTVRSQRPARPSQRCPADRRRASFPCAGLTASPLAAPASALPAVDPASSDHPEASPELGTVYLVGAGPGDPELLTLRAHRLLQRCDALVYDSLVPQDLLDLVPEGCARHFVGKRRGHHSVPQPSTNAVLVSWPAAAA